VGGYRGGAWRGGGGGGGGVQSNGLFGARVVDGVPEEGEWGRSVSLAFGGGEGPRTPSTKGVPRVDEERGGGSALPLRGCVGDKGHPVWGSGMRDS